MSRKPRRVPSYRLHKPSGQARVIINGEHIYLGLYGSPESQEKYARLVAELAVSSNGPNGRPPHSGEDDLLLCELVVRYLDYAKGYYVKDGKVGREFSEMRMALRPLLSLYGNEKARNFGPIALKAVRHLMVESDLSRGVANHRINRIKRVFKWAVSEQLLPPSIYEGLRSVTGLMYGRTVARETEPVKPVPKEWVDPVIPSFSAQVAAMVQVQWLAGMRPCEVVLMRPCDIDTTGDIWIYEPHDHKNRWRDHSRVIPLGPKAQAILRPFMDRPPEAYLFSPREAEEARNAKRRESRKTPMTPSQAKRRPKPAPKRPRRDPN